MSRIAALDYGDARIGVAISDPGKIIASPLVAVAMKPSLRLTAEEIAQLLGDYMPIEKIVIGLPLLMNGKESESSQKVRAFVPFLEEITGLEIVLWDERLTTAQVERTLKEANLSRKKRSRYVDAMAASAILQSYLDRA